MSAISLARVPEITQGAGSLETLGTALAGRVPAKSGVLLVADPGLGPSGAIDTAAAALGRAGFGVLRFSDLKSDPTMAQVDAATELARREHVAMVVGLGGGSAMDVGKAIAAIAAGRAGASHYGLCANPFPATRLVSVCVPTTSGTGSEATRTAVFAAADGAKVWLWGDELKPVLIVLDPVLTTGLPAALTAATGIDALVHAIEASTNANANEVNDLYCHRAIALVVRHLRRAVGRARGPLCTRQGLQWAATLAGIGIDNCGTAIAHNIGHALASLRPVHHGAAVGLALRATLPWNVAEGVRRALRRRRCGDGRAPRGAPAPGGVRPPAARFGGQGLARRRGPRPRDPGGARRADGAPGKRRDASVEPANGRGCGSAEVRDCSLDGALNP